ncbi:hypothetical protein CVV38_01610 [Candidatus Peregrinibacteria bacterium HGW-Peregrinibacteria-1]|jgi:hypothetical protein|nr:MAG: hypothetical protein CVV38_01610 [Candidatus Peregrinibacteria bacterium HGW-Peregrinibacteria-1]
MKKRLVDITTDSDEVIELQKNKRKKHSPKFFKPLKNNKQNHRFFSDLTPPTSHQTHEKHFKKNLPRGIEKIIPFFITGFIIILIITGLHAFSQAQKLQGSIIEQANIGLDNIINAGQNTLEVRFKNAKELFSQAVENFEQARNDVWFLRYSSTSSSDPITQAVSILLESGENIATAGDHFVDALNELGKIAVYMNSTAENTEKPSLTKILKNGLAQVDLAIEQITIAGDNIAKIDPTKLPEAIAEQLFTAQQQLHDLSEILNSISEHFPALLKLLGDEHPHRYLILLQNDTEIRPSGGFIGNYGIMDINNGYIESLEIHDVYALDNFYTEFIEPPEEFKAFTDNWRLRDSNYSHHFPLSAEKARWFLETEGGPSVDSVIAINQSIVPDLLRVTGPINIEGFGEISAENYYPLMTYVVESKLWAKNDPKQFLRLFIDGFKQKALTAKNNISDFGRIMLEEINKENIMLYSQHDQIQEFSRLLGISGEIKYDPDQPPTDYLSIVNISTGGTKTDPFIDEKITHHTTINQDGSINNELSIIRTHTWTEAQYQSWQKIFADYGIDPINQETIYIIGRGRNRMNTKVYVPKGSQIITDEYTTPVTTKHDPELNLDYFYYTSEIFPGESHQLFIKYRLPNKLTFNPATTYRIQIDKQPGNQGSIFTKTLSTAPDLEIIKNYPTSVKTNRLKNSIFATNLTYDRNFAAIITK